MDNKTHYHNPCRKRNGFTRFLSYCFFPNKIFFADDASGVCAHCNIPIKAPPAYYQLGLKISYAIFSFCLTFFWGQYTPIWLNRSLIRVPILLFLIFLYDRIASAVVFAFFEWRPYDSSNDDINKSAAYTRKNQIIKYQFVVYGIGIALIIWSILGW